jgi:predicted nuclease of predicted toxin-antitoxin system
VRNAGGGGYRFLCDEHISVPVYRALDAIGVDIVHILALGLGGIDDPEVLQYARDQRRILLTRNYRDFAPLVEKWAHTGEGFAGVLFVAPSIPQADVSAHVRAMQTWVENAEAGDNRIENTYGWLRPIQ